MSRQRRLKRNMRAAIRVRHKDKKTTATQAEHGRVHDRGGKGATLPAEALIGIFRRFTKANS